MKKEVEKEEAIKNENNKECVMKKDDDGLKNIEVLLEKLLDELIVEASDYNSSNVLPIPTKLFLEMEDIVGEKINLIGLS